MSRRHLKRLVAAAIIAAGIYGASRPLLSVPRWTRPPRSDVAFATGGAGSRAGHVDAEWRLSTGGSNIGLIMSVAVCGDDAFLLDRQLGVVHRADLTAGTIVGDASPRRLSYVNGLAADCAAEELYVVDGTGVGVFSMTTGQPLARYAKPPAFTHSLGAPVLDPESRTLAVPGLWSSRGSWHSRSMDRMFDGERIGYHLNLDTGKATPMVDSVERGCWSDGPNCIYATLDRAGGSTRAQWLAAHRVGMAVGVYDEQYRLLRAIDVRSPGFRETGERNERKVLTDMVQWNEDNSVIRQVYGFGSRIVTVHSHNRTRGWKPGGRTDFAVFMNVHTLGGASMASDLRLPDLPVGRDDRGLYVVDYGAAGRRPLGRDPIRLVRIGVPQ